MINRRSSNECGTYGNSAHLNVIRYSAAVFSVSTRNVMAALCVSEKDLVASSFEVVMMDRSSTLLSIKQRDIDIRYRGLRAHVAIVFCSEISKLLLFR
jgi:hypothetical protein